MIKKDEIVLIKTILKHSKQKGDMIHRVSIDKLNMNPKRLLFLLQKLYNRGILECGINIYFGWIDKDPLEIIEHYKKIHGVDITCQT